MTRVIRLVALLGLGRAGTRTSKFMLRVVSNLVDTGMHGDA